MKSASARLASGPCALQTGLMADGDKPASDKTIDVDGNRLTLFTEGPERLEALVGLIDGAKTSVRLLYYMYRDDSSGEQVYAAMERAIDRGITVSLLIDGFGAFVRDEYFTPLTEKGLRYCRFNPTFGRRYLIRCHQKMTLVDDRRAMIGGFNVEHDYFAPAGQPGAWRDLGLMVDGPATGRLVAYYDDFFRWSSTKGSKIRALNRLIRTHSESHGTLQWIFGGPMTRLSPWAAATSRDLLSSDDVAMIAAYFAPTRAILRRIGRPERKRARIITAAKSDNHATVAAARYTYKNLLKRGAEIFEYQAGKLHTKLVILDDVVHIGSSNFDIRSIYLNLEMMLRVDDPRFAMLLRNYFEQELAQCEPITAELHHRRTNWWTRIVQAISFFLVTTADYTITRRLNLGRV
jgi:cardiolipin synthase A/B